MSNYNQNSSYGAALVNMVAAQVPVFGRILVVMSPSDTAGERYQRLQEVMTPDIEGFVRFYTSLETAYAAAETNNNDVILLDGTTAHTIAAGIAWSKSRIHLVGMDGGGRMMQQGARVQSTGNPDTGYIIKVTGTRNTFRNVKWDQNSTDAAALTVAQFGGEGTYVQNCSFVFSTATNLDGNETTTYEVVMGEDSGTFINCTFGSDTLDTTGARAVMAIDQVTTSQEMKSCFFKDCMWTICSDDANANFIRVIANTDLKFAQTFVNPIFVSGINASTGGVILTDAVDSVAGLVEGNFLFVNPATNCTNFSSAITNNIKVVGMNSGDTATLTADVGVAVTPA